MGKKIIVVNAGPRKGWNTDSLLTEASKGAESAGAEVERFDLFQLEKYTGCVSCFGCKKEKFKGCCIRRDALTPVLDAIRESDGLIIGSPNYLGELTASFRALYERLIFQNLTYNIGNAVLQCASGTGPADHDQQRSGHHVLRTAERLSADPEPVRGTGGGSGQRRYPSAEGLQQDRLAVEHVRRGGKKEET